jgi:hypothetical protein
VPRRSVTGTVVSLTERKFGDVLPTFVQTAIWSRGLVRGGGHGFDRRKIRTELVLETSDGHKRWTVRNHRHHNALNVGRRVTLSVSPLVGYVARVKPHQAVQRRIT